MIKTFVAVVPLAAVMLAQQGSVEACGGGETGILPDWVYFSPPLPVPPPPSAVPPPRRRTPFIVPPPVGPPGAPPAVPQDLAPARE